MRPTTRTRVLFVSSDNDLLRSTLPALRASGYVPYVVSVAVSSTIGVIARSVQAIIIDIGVSRTLAPAWDLMLYLLQVTRVPLITLTGQERVDHRVRALRAGVHDALSRPIDPSDLVSLLNSLVHSALPITCSPSVILSPRTIVDLTDSLIATDGQVIPLTSRETRLLKYFVYHANRFISREELCCHLGMSSDYLGQSYLRQLISHLRRKIEGTPDNFAWLETERGQGYCLRVRDPWTPVRQMS